MADSIYEDCPPKPEAMITSLRAFGYDISMAIADLIDNSIFAGARKICIDYSWNQGKPWIRVLDDGSGMSEPALKEAMRLGSQSPLEDRDPADLGRFGLGMKTASFSQCRSLTVKTKTDNGCSAIRCWDLDKVVALKRWALANRAPRGSATLLSPLDRLKCGTVVLWQKLDRIIQPDSEEDGNDIPQEHFNNCFLGVARYMEMVFHRYLAGKDAVKIEVGRKQCAPWDPFLAGNKFTQELSTERLDDSRVTVTPYVLPHVSKRSHEETTVGAGVSGWNAHQGFYVYRNRRMIIAGGYLDFGFTPEEHFKLCRILVDLPNHMDHDWSIDVRKATASPPNRVRRDLDRIARATRSKAVMIYRARTGNARLVGGRNNNFTVWLKKRRGDKVIYELNREHPVITEILKEQDPPKSWTRKLFHIIEHNVPHRVIIEDNATNEDCHVGLPPNLAKPPDELLKLCRDLFTRELDKGKTPQDATDFVCAMFDDHVAYRVMLDHLTEDLK